MNIEQVNRVIAQILGDLGVLFPTEEESAKNQPKKKPAPENDNREWELEQWVEYKERY